jgi:hypothetical protein
VPYKPQRYKFLAVVLSLELIKTAEEESNKKEKEKEKEKVIKIRDTGGDNSEEVIVSRSSSSSQ